ncbi:MAG TPA: NAD(P)H-dependent oxidoreductase [Tessaracoccus flavescens]|uniref:NAD(P)H-dependent oxidoreductase n=1 Tax=Tessaracoccus flavescens TaxID=399497 RepID=A0A921EMV6_9ACTN|nr:NAD(P)H-dependent oxidoreductase [Tessaracoccus flavescens]
MKIAILTSTVRPGRNSIKVAEWVKENAPQIDGVEFELVDIAEYDLPLYDEPMPAAYGQYANEHTKKWAAKVAEFDGYVFVTAEYNHAAPSALLNAIAYPYQEWNNKAAAFVGFGSLGGARAVENLRLVAAEIQLADVRQGVYLSLFDDFENFADCKPRENQLEALGTMFEQLISWSKAMKTLR